MSSTQNVKGNRKILLAQYKPREGVFKIPDGIDLDYKTVVSEYDVKYDTPTINYVNVYLNLPTCISEFANFKFEFRLNLIVYGSDNCRKRNFGNVDVVNNRTKCCFLVVDKLVIRLPLLLK